MVMWQTAGKGEAQETPLAEAAYGQNVVIGMVSTLVQNWSYNLALAPGAGLCGADVWVQVWVQVAGYRLRLWGPIHVPAVLRSARKR